MVHESNRYYRVIKHKPGKRNCCLPIEKSMQFQILLGFSTKHKRQFQLMHCNPAEYQLFVYNLEIKISHKIISFDLDFQVFQHYLWDIQVGKIKSCMEKANKRLTHIIETFISCFCTFHCYHNEKPNFWKLKKRLLINFFMNFHAI